MGQGKGFGKVLGGFQGVRPVKRTFSNGIWAPPIGNKPPIYSTIYRLKENLVGSKTPWAKGPANFFKQK